MRKIFLSKLRISIGLRLVASVILLQTLFFKFTAAPESVAIFELLGIEPWGRVGSGILELLAVILLWIPSTILYGAMGISISMAFAILSHFLVLGIEIQGDGGLLFILALIVLSCALGVHLMHSRKKL